MPLYEYECEKCGATFETLQHVSARPLKTCQGLGCSNKDNGKVHRMVSASGFILKGSGWYTSDYPSEARKKGWESESKQAAGAPDGGSDAPEKKAPAASPPAPAKESAASKPAPPTAPQKPSQKNPYTGGKRSGSKTSK